MGIEELQALDGEWGLDMEDGESVAVSATSDPGIVAITTLGATGGDASVLPGLRNLQAQLLRLGDAVRDASAALAPVLARYEVISDVESALEEEP